MPDFIEFHSADFLINLAVAAAVGFLIGFEREWTHEKEDREHTFAGARTFTLVGFAGGLSGLIGGGLIVPAIAFAAVAALTVASYWFQAKTSASRGGTTEIAVFAAFLLGLAAAEGYLLIAAVGGVFVALVLSMKRSVRKLAGALSETEIHAALRFLVISIIVLPVLPDQAFGPYGALNPRAIWLMVVFISGLSFLGYWLTRTLGAERGLLVTGIVGGLASSTATTVSLAGFVRDGKAKPAAAAAGIIAANTVMIVRIGILLAATSRLALIELWPALAAGALVGGVAALMAWRTVDKGDTHSVRLGNPMEIRPALIFAGLLAVVSMAAAFGADRFGESGLYLVGLISGFVDVDAMTLAAGSQAAIGDIAAGAAAITVMIAAGANSLAKAVMAAAIGGRRTGVIVGISFAAMAFAAGAAYAGRLFWF